MLWINDHYNCLNSFSAGSDYDIGPHTERVKVLIVIKAMFDLQKRKLVRVTQL